MAEILGANTGDLPGEHSFDYIYPEDAGAAARLFDLKKKGDAKALILIGHVASEQAGMTFCAEWLTSFITDVPVQFVPASEPFWSPPAPRA